MATGDSLVYFDALAGRPPGTDPAHLDSRNGNYVLDFSQNDDLRVDFHGVLPGHYRQGGARVKVAWAATSVTTGDVVWRAEFERRESADSGSPFDLDVDAFGTVVEATATVPSVNGRLAITEIVVSSAEMSGAEAGDLFRLRVTRVGNDSADTAADDAELYSVKLSEA